MLRLVLLLSCLASVNAVSSIPFVRHFTTITDAVVAFPTETRDELILRFTLAPGRRLFFSLSRDVALGPTHLLVATVGADGRETAFAFDSAFYRGHKPADPSQDYALFLHLNASGVAGVLSLDGRLHMLTPIGSGRHALYSAKDLDWPSHRCTASATPPSIPRRQQKVERRSLQTHNTCLMAGVADYRFYAFCGSDVASTVLSIIAHITFSDTYFRATNFSGATNIGVALSKATVYTSTATDPLYRAGAWDARHLLSAFSTMDWGNYCLAHLFTYQDFGGGIQGLAWVAPAAGSGGICDGYGVHTGAHYNTGLTTLMSFQSTVPSLMALLVTTHELGHNFGSSHDANPGACSPSSSGGGHYIMNAISVDGSDSNNYLFSSCSIAYITPVLNAKGSCFTTRPNAMCGNGRVEINGTDGLLGTADDEQCDVGFTGDACCTADCKLTPGSNCSNVNSVCCVNCSSAAAIVAPNGTVVRAAKRCFLSFANDALCRADTFCTNSSYSCPQPLNQKAVGAQCSNGGACATNANETQRCVSICKRFGAAACRCAGTASCHICCLLDTSVPPLCPVGLAWLTRSFPNGTSVTACLNQSETTLASSSIIHPGFRPFTNSCTDAATVLTVAPYDTYLTPLGVPYSAANLVLDDGSPCSSGQCSSGVCSAKSSDVTSTVAGFFSSLSASSLAGWMRTNVVATVLLLSLLLWVPGSILLARRDRVRVAALAEKLPPKRRNTFATHAQPPAIALTRVAPAPASGRTVVTTAVNPVPAALRGREPSLAESAC